MKSLAAVAVCALSIAPTLRAQVNSDVVIAVDTSGDMGVEAAMVSAALNNFAGAMSSTGVDLHVVLIAAPSNSQNGICIPAPFGSGSCPSDSNLPIYRHNTTEIHSTDALQVILNTYGSWSASLRPGVSTEVIVVTSDNSNLSAANFDVQFRALDPNFQNYRLHALVATQPCMAGASVGQIYIQLAIQTGGLVRDLCNQDFGPDFDAIAMAIADSPLTFCTSSTTTHGCAPSIAASGTPSASSTSGFTLMVSSVEGNRAGLIFYGVSNTVWTPLPWSPASTSYLCVAPPTQRTTAQVSGGTTGQCNGVLSIDWSAFVAANPGSLGAPFASGNQVFAQGWFRDPPAPKTTNLSNALRFTLVP
jgi:hypothetical protein